MGRRGKRKCLEVGGLLDVELEVLCEAAVLLEDALGRDVQPVHHLLVRVPLDLHQLPQTPPPPHTPYTSPVSALGFAVLGEGGGSGGSAIWG